MDEQIPALSAADIESGLAKAAAATRRRHPLILHEPGAELNRVVNFMMHDSYMQPHLHPGPEKIERIHLIDGALAVIFFDDVGATSKVTALEPGGAQLVEVPAFTWHTYVMLSDRVVTYETMMGEYAPKTWKEFAGWAPPEHDATSAAYLESLRKIGEAARHRR